MANMSYCRFRNTKSDLEDCLDALMDEKELSREEHRAFKNMFIGIYEFLCNEGIIDDDGETEERLYDYINSIKIDE